MTDPLQVSELVNYVKRELESDSLLQQVQVVGEVSNFKRHSSGHLYFTLKDEQSKMKAVMFARDASRVKTDVRDGARVVLTARLSVYLASGEMQLYVERMMEDGVGALYEAYVRLKDDLETRGWFEESLKQPLPTLPGRIGIITSPKGAALHDIATTLRRRYPQAAIIFAPVLVQGKEAVPQIARAIQLMNEHQACDVMIIGRGGGSIEELWAFNEIDVVTAIHESNIPIVSAVGHETDFTIADFVADVRAATPTAAAELVTPEAAELEKRVADLKRRLTRNYDQYIKERKDRVTRLAGSYGLKSPRVLLGLKQERLDRAEMGLSRISKQMMQVKQQALGDVSKRLQRIPLRERLSDQGRELIRTRKQLERIHHVMRSKQERLHQMIARLDSVSPTQVLLRGYTYVEQEGQLVRSVHQLSDQTFRVQFHDGSILAKREDEDEDGNGTNL
ncbi:exodeoxyribonuclease VII large subunit [Exiguobacterium sp. RIT452]|uniref:exodeoxyribonuclease VII large subunit n=1 Tax=Exiguobacterium sp. RIT452 TaxID=2315552 RepID=UPI000E72C742|nr:exodeoxyribonuclease VII large subunit [Exiguobacterium sp. RIT452]RJP01991.1 exodeoxyribonuclease VII large subunit [Exiguobacterium sp. RIT452]